MPLLGVQTRRVRVSIRLTDTTANRVGQYASFIHASAGDVTEQALVYVFSKCRDFEELFKSADAQFLRLLNVSVKHTQAESELVAKKPDSLASLPIQAIASVAGSKAESRTNISSRTTTVLRTG